MGKHLEGKVAVVTGAGRGIGRGVALQLAAQGARVVVADYGGAVNAREAGTSAPADEVVAEIVAAGGEAVASAEDVAAMSGGQRIVETAMDNFGRLDGLVCCAGINVFKHFWDLTERDFDDVVAVHLKGHFSCVQAATKVMMPQGSGSLVFYSSGAWTGMPTLASYAASKAGILGLMWSAAHAFDRFGIRANAVIPSAATRMSDSIYGGAGRLTDEVSETVRSANAAGSYRDPATSAPMVVYLLSDQARDVNGQVFNAIGYKIDRLGPIAFDRSMTSDGPWDIDALFERFPAEMGSDLKMRTVPWPEPVS